MQSLFRSRQASFVSRVSARFTNVPTIARLYCSEPRRSLVGLHSCDAMLPASATNSAVSFLPVIKPRLCARAPASGRHSRARCARFESSHPCLNVSRTATPADGLSTTELLEKRMYSMPDRGGSGGNTTWVMISSSAKLVV